MSRIDRPSNANEQVPNEREKAMLGLQILQLESDLLVLQKALSENEKFRTDIRGQHPQDAKKINELNLVAITIQRTVDEKMAEIKELERRRAEFSVGKAIDRQ